jgi:hypothetical protein
MAPLHEEQMLPPAPQPPALSATELPARQQTETRITLQEQHFPYHTAAPLDVQPLKEQPRPLETPPWLQEKLPFGFPRRPPDLWGTVIHVHSQQEVAPYSGLSSIARQLRDAIWYIPSEVHHPYERERVQVTTIRVRRPDGRQQDARIQGYLRGANVSLGDTISIWGSYRKGAFIIHKAFDHTAHGTVYTTATASALPFYAVILLLLLLFLLFLYFFQVPFTLPGL